jgi:hypothetical protein
LPDDIVSPADDANTAPGIQIDVTVNTSLTPGYAMTLYLDGEALSEPTEADENGTLVFENVSLPYGSVQLTVLGRNQCKDVKSSKSLFVFDEQGDILCQMTLTGASLGAGGVETWPAAADADAIAPGFQGEVVVTTGRDDVKVKILILDVDMGTEVSLHEDASPGGEVVFMPTLPAGRHALRATCEWAAISVPRHSSTHTVEVQAL